MFAGLSACKRGGQGRPAKEIAKNIAQLDAEVYDALARLNSAFSSGRTRQPFVLKPGVDRREVRHRLVQPSQFHRCDRRHAELNRTFRTGGCPGDNPVEASHHLVPSLHPFHRDSSRRESTTSSRRPALRHDAPLVLDMGCNSSGSYHSNRERPTASDSSRRFGMADDKSASVSCFGERLCAGSWVHTFHRGWHCAHCRPVCHNPLERGCLWREMARRPPVPPRSGAPPDLLVSVVCVCATLWSFPGRCQGPKPGILLLAHREATRASC